MAALYKPPTQVVQSDIPYLSLVTQVDPSWANLKFREVEYEFDGRAIRFNPYWTGAYSGLSNIYPVGLQWGGMDPNFVPLSSTNLGAVANQNAQSVALTLAAAVPAGTLIALLVTDSSFTGPIPANAVSDGSTEYETVFSSLIAQSGAPVALIAGITTQTLGAGATLTYESPGTPSNSNGLAMLGIAIAGGVQPTIFDPKVGDGQSIGTGFGNSALPSATSGNPQQQNELFLGFAVAAANGTFAADAVHGWNSLQQVSTGGGTGLALCSSMQSGGAFDPGVNASVIFSPALAGNAPWSVFVFGVLPTKPMFSGTNDDMGWA